MPRNTIVNVKNAFQQPINKRQQPIKVWSTPVEPQTNFPSAKNFDLKNFDLRILLNQPLPLLKGQLG